MKILILRVYNTYNTGSAMMAINAIWYLNRELVLSGEKAEFYTDIEDTENLERLKRSTGLENISISEVEPPKYWKKSLFKRIAGKIIPAYSDFFYRKEVGRFKSIIEGRFDAAIILGGDDLAGEYPLRGIRNQLFLIGEISKIMKVVLVGHTIGPFSQKAAIEFREYLKESVIYARDERTFDYLAMHIQPYKLERMSDLAFLDLPFQQRKLTGLSDYDLTDGGYITLVPSGLTGYYSSNMEDYIGTWTGIASSILDNLRLKKHKLVMLAHVMKPEKVSDAIVIKKIEQKLSGKYGSRIVSICNENLLPFEIRNILGGGLLTITGRMHAAVSTFQMGRPAISIAYSSKYQGVLGDGLGFKEFIIDGRGDEKWEGNFIIQNIDKRIENILDNYFCISERISGKMDDLKTRNHSTIKSICCDLDSDNCYESIIRRTAT